MNRVTRIMDTVGIKHRRGRFTGKLPDTYAVWFDNVATDGPDGHPCVWTHDITVEIYESKPDDRAETLFEAGLVTEGLMFTKQDRFWIESEQMYQVVYDINYKEKRRI